MENQSAKLIARSLKFGLYLGLVYIITTLLTYILNINMLSIGYGIIYFLISAAIVVTFLVFAMKEVREQVYGGVLPYGNRFLVGLIVGLIGGWISGLFSMVLFNLYDPGFIEDQILQFSEKLIEYGVDEAGALEQENKIREGMTIAGRLKSLLIYAPIFSAVLSLIVAAFVKKELNANNDKVM